MTFTRIKVFKFNEGVPSFKITNYFRVTESVTWSNLNKRKKKLESINLTY